MTFRAPLCRMLLAFVASTASSGAAEPPAAPPPLDPAVGQALAGTYRFGDGREVTLGPFDEFGGHLALLDLATLDQRLLAPQPDGTFAMGTTTLSPSPRQATLRFERREGGRATALHWAEAGGATRTAARVYPTRHEEVEFRSGAVVLRGRLSVPDGPGPHPAVVMVHGSGPATRNVGFFTTVYERLGIAVLSFDKRGAGASTGDWRSAPFDDLAADVLAGVSLLAARPDIDRTRIGLEGTSQGGWVASMAAARAPGAVAWLIVRVGSGVSVLENMLHEDVAALRKEGLDAAQVAEVVAFDRELYTAAMRGEPHAAAERVAARHAGRPWFGGLYPQGFRMSEATWAWLRANAAIESVDHLRHVKVPVAWYLGVDDGNVPSARSMPRIVQALVDAGNRDFSVTMLPTDHSFLAALGPDGDVTRATRYVPGYIEANATWLRARGFAAHR